ncbi:MAG: DUF192 domain-containing protein [Phycisphaerales bacterium]|nr:DUF192 domain-containing protein [Phycisphaerales bacterium]
MAAGPIVKKPSKGSPVVRMLAGAALLAIIAAVVVTTVPGGCERRESIATTSDKDTQREVGARAPGGIERVTIHGVTYDLELAADNPTRMKGLGGRDHIDERGGMLFVFRVPTRLNFVMRDCLVPIDIIFVDSSGLVTATHTMPPEEPRRPGETELLYENRLKKYSSRFTAQFAIELQAGQIEKLGVKQGDKIALDVVRLQNLAR